MIARLTRITLLKVTRCTTMIHTQLSIFQVIFLFLTIFLTVQCSSDSISPPEGCDAMEPTYNTMVKPIIDQTCAYSGCHDGSGGIGPGDYSSYSGLQQIINDGSFTDRVINLKDNASRGMPPNSSVYPESQQDDLSEAQFEIISCWIQDGFPEQ